MSKPEITRESLDRDTTVILGDIVALRRRLEAGGEEGAHLALPLAEGLAEMIAMQFPDTAGLGRIVVSLAIALRSLRDGAAEAIYPVDIDADVMLAVSLLAGEQLDREARNGE